MVKEVGKKNNFVTFCPMTMVEVEKDLEIRKKISLEKVKCRGMPSF